MSTFGPLKNIENIQELNATLSEFIRSQYVGASEVSILEAGCGKKWPLDLAGLNYRLTGVDLDEDGLELRKEQQKDLDVAILADLCTVELDGEQFDVVYSSYVLEHINGAETALENFLKWLKPAGVLILKFPDRDSVFGFITRLVPFRLHVWYKKYLYKLPNAGTPGHGPFPTVYDRVVSRKGMYKFCDSHNLNILHEYGTNYYLKKLGGLAMIVKPVLKMIELISLQKLKSDHNNLVFIIQKPSSNGHGA